MHRKRTTLFTLPKEERNDLNALKEEIKYEFPFISKLQITEDDSFFFIAWVSRKYSYKMVHDFFNAPIVQGKLVDANAKSAQKKLRKQKRQRLNQLYLAGMRREGII